MHPSRERSVRRGMTLVELLVVIGILMTLAAIAVPALKPSFESRRIRETARMVNVYLSAAQIRAIETGRKYGVQIQRAPGLPQAGVILQQVEEPAGYAGDWQNTSVAVQEWPNYWPRMVVLKLMVREGDFFFAHIRPGDLVQFNNQGPFYTLAWDTGDFPLDADGFYNFTPTNRTPAPSPAKPWITNYFLTVALSQLTAPATPWAKKTDNPAWTSEDAAPWGNGSPVGVTVQRVPAKSAVAPLQLSSTVAVDLAFSGTNTLSFDAGVQIAPGNYVPDPYPVTIMFSPTGEVDAYYVRGAKYRIKQPIYLLVGRRDRVTTDLDPTVFQNAAYTSQTDDGLMNWKDQMNLWVTINPMTGLVVTEELAEAAASWQASRKYAAGSQGIGGR